jgi:transposase
VRARDDLVAHRVALANQLRALLESFWPGAAAIFAEIDSPIALAFLARYPTPQSAERLGEKRLQAFLARHAYCGRRSAASLLERLHHAPRGFAGTLEAQAKGHLVRTLVTVLGSLVDEIRTTSAAVALALSRHPDGSVVASFPRAGRINAAQILAELGDDPSRFPSDESLATEAGVAPVTRQSGKHRAVCCRWACNKRLRRALTGFAGNSRHSSPWAAHVYHRARDRGCDHAHATRILARAWCRVLWRCWHQHTPYRPSAHRAAVQLSRAA